MDINGNDSEQNLIAPRKKSQSDKLPDPSSLTEAA